MWLSVFTPEAEWAVYLPAPHVSSEGRQAGGWAGFPAHQCGEDEQMAPVRPSLVTGQQSVPGRAPGALCSMEIPVSASGRF